MPEQIDYDSAKDSIADLSDSALTDLFLDIASTGHFWDELSVLAEQNGYISNIRDYDEEGERRVRDFIRSRKTN